jgi:hypothetical protein
VPSLQDACSMTIQYSHVKLPETAANALATCHAPFFGDDCAAATCGHSYWKGTFSMPTSPLCWPPFRRCSRHRHQGQLGCQIWLQRQCLGELTEQLNQARYFDVPHPRARSVRATSPWCASHRTFRSHSTVACMSIICPSDANNVAKTTEAHL